MFYFYLYAMLPSNLPIDHCLYPKISAKLSEKAYVARTIGFTTFSTTDVVETIRFTQQLQMQTCLKKSWPLTFLETILLKPLA